MKVNTLKNIRRGSKLFKYISETYHDKKWIDIENELKRFALDDKGKNILFNKTEKDFELLRVSLCDYLSSLSYESINKESAACMLIESVINNYLFKKSVHI